MNAWPCLVAAALLVAGATRAAGGSPPWPPAAATSRSPLEAQPPAAPAADLVLTDTLDVGDAASEAAHGYAARGEASPGPVEAAHRGDDGAPLADRGRRFSGASRFTVAMAPESSGVRLRRRADPAVAGQRARLYVDGALVRERLWGPAGGAAAGAWADEFFDVPPAYTAGKRRLAIRVEPVAPAVWTEFHYWIYSRRGPPPEDLLVGRWQGSWQSHRRGETGALECTVRLRPDGVYEARFDATYWRVFSMKQTLPLAVEACGQVWRFTGQADLGLLAGGVYRHEGSSDGREFVSRYAAKRDEGEFRLQRVPPPPPKP
jgi:hypothetical protein